MNGVGEMKKKILSMLFTIALASTLVTSPAQLASAKNFSTEGIDFSWKVPFLPSKYGCKDITINYKNNGEGSYSRVWLSIVNKYEDRLGENFAPYVEPGDSGVIRIQVCNTELHGPRGYQLVVETRTYDYKVAVSSKAFKFKKRK